MIMENSKEETKAWIKDTFEFGHNIGLALALAGFGAVAYHVETVGRMADWNKYLAVLCLLVAALWGGFSADHFVNQLLKHTKLNRKVWASILIGALGIALGVSVIFLAPLIPDNNHIVALCDKYKDAVGDKIHDSEECQRLYKKRADYEQLLRGK